MREKEDLGRGNEKVRERLYADMGSHENVFGREKIMQEGEKEVKTDWKIFVCGDEVGKDDVFVITGDTRLTDAGRRNEERREIEDVAKVRIQLRAVLERSMALTASWWAADWRLEIWCYAVLKRVWAGSQMPA